MAANSDPSRRRKRGGFPPADEPSTTTQRPSGASSEPGPPRRWGLIALFLIVSVGGTYVAMWLKQPPGVRELSYEIVNTYPHDPTAYTQGLLWDNGVLYESTGQLERSSIRKVDLETGDVMDKKDLADDIFAEGLALANDKFYQLTWKNNVIFVYDRKFNLIKKVPYDHEGWGLTFDGTHLVASDGTAYLRFLDPETLEEVRAIRVRHGRQSIWKLNELEMHGPDLYANVYQTNLIYWINKEDGEVKAKINLADLWPLKDRPNNDAVLNGIAIDPQNNRLFVTGKDCPHLWEIKIVDKKE